MAKKRASALLTAWRGLQKAKTRHCSGKGKTTAADVRSKAKRYVSLAVKAGQSKTEATRKANKILNKACKK